MLTQEQETKLTDSIPEDTTGEDLRTAYSVITGYKEGKSAEQIASYYSVDISDVNRWFSYFGLAKKTTASGKKRGRKGKDIQSYINSNMGRTLSAKEISQEAGVSLPTFYNYFNANRGYFKKVTRGQFEIINPSTERSQDS